MSDIHLTADDLWTALRADEEQWAEMETAVVAFKADPFRDKMLFLRQTAHQRIRQLLSDDKLQDLTLADFNQHVWQIGTVTYKGVQARMDKSEIEDLLQDLDLATVERAYETGDLLLGVIRLGAVLRQSMAHNYAKKRIHKRRNCCAVRFVTFSMDLTKMRSG